MLVHCGAWNQDQDCFIVLNSQGVQIRDSSNAIVYKCEHKNVQYKSSLKMMEMEGNKFYFWKRLEYIEA